MRNKITFILLFLANTLHGQIVSFYLKDKETDMPIGLAAVYTQRGIGTYSQEDGIFQLNMHSTDSLFIQHLGYNSLKFSLSDLKSLTSNIIYLTPKKIELQQVVIKSTKPKKLSLGYFKEKTISKRASPGGRSNFQVFANHIKNPTGYIGILEKLHFDLHVDITERSNSTVRIRVFSVGENGLPDKDLLTKEIIKKVDRITPNIHINVSEYNILFPPEGVFIGLEFFCSFEVVAARRKGHTKNITDCPHIASSKVSNAEELGHSFYWTLHNKKFQWICSSNGSVHPGLKGYVFKFGADILCN